MAAPTLPYMDLGDGSYCGVPGNYQIQGICQVQGAFINGNYNDDGRCLILDEDAQTGTISGQEMIQNKIWVQTSVTGASTFTLADVRTAQSGLADQFRFHFKSLNPGDYLVRYYINDGNQTVTLSAGANMTFIPATPSTIATTLGATLIIKCTNATKGSETFVVYVVA